MSYISPQTLKLLRRFRSARNRTLPVYQLRELMPDEEYRHRMDILLGEGYIELADVFSSRKSNGALFLGEPKAYRLTTADIDYLSMCDQKDQEKADKKRIEEQDKAQAKEDKIKDRRHDYHVAAFGAVLGAVLTLLVEHFDQVAAWLISLFH